MIVGQGIRDPIKAVWLLRDALFVSAIVLIGGTHKYTHTFTHTATISHNVVVTVSVKHWLEAKIRKKQVLIVAKTHRCAAFSLLFFSLRPHIDTFTMYMKASVSHIYGTDMITSTWNPFLAVSQSDWHCFQGTPCPGACGSLIRINKRTSHRKPGIAHGELKALGCDEYDKTEEEEVRVERQGWL